MKVIDVYQQYFSSRCLFNGVTRNAVSVKLTATSKDGTVRYEASVSFFPHKDPEDFAVSYDAFAAKELYHEKGRRSKKREQEFMKVSGFGNLPQPLPGTVNWSVS